jgi:uncharacterized protein (DUF1697 family)
MKYVAFIRAINVGGTSVIRMADLRRHFEDFGYEDVSTYIQTGNVIFAAPKTAASKLEQQIEQQLSQVTGWNSRAFVRTQAQLKAAAKANPFTPQNDPDLVCHLVILAKKPSAANIAKLEAMSDEDYSFSVDGSVVYFSYPKRVAGQRRSINIEKILGVAGTSRTWKVIDTLIELMA